MKKLILVSIIFLLNLDTSAQSTLNATGGSFKTSNQQHDYSIAEMTIINTAKNNNYIITQGLLQPEIENNPNTLALEMLLYPNPVQNNLYLETTVEENATLYLTIFDPTGKLIQTNKFEINKGKAKNIISLNNYASGNYLLNAIVTSNEKTQQRSFKILKTN